MKQRMSGMVMIPFAARTRLSYVRFLAYEAAGALAWASLFVVIGYALGESGLILVQRWGATTGLLAAGSVVVWLSLVGYGLWRRRVDGAPHRAWTYARWRAPEAECRGNEGAVG
jgi:membrane protein DedA with SNARE-associated domain